MKFSVANDNGQSEYLALPDREIFLSGKGIHDATVNGSATGVSNVELGDIDYPFYGFTDGVLERGFFHFVCPSDYNNTSMTFKFVWSTASSSTNSVTWSIKHVSLGNSGDLTSPLSTGDTVSDANTGADLLNVSSSIILPITGAAGNFLILEVARLGNADTLADVARLHGISVTYPV